MSRPLRLEFPGALWHVTARGNERREIYRNDEDRAAWLDLLGAAVVDSGWILHAYVLMPNHYHLLVETPDSTLSQGMRQLNGVYTQAFNRKHKRVGHLFQGRFKGILVSEETHLIELLRYIVLNPVRARLCRGAGQWRWSNYRATAGKSLQPKWLEVNRTISLFSAGSRAEGRKRYAKFVHSARDAEYQPWEHLRGQIYLGNDEFAKRMQDRIEKDVSDVEIPRPQRSPARPGLQRVVEAACKIAGVPAESLTRQHRSDARLMVALLGRQYHYSQREIGNELGIDRAAVSMLVNFAKERRESNQKFRSVFGKCVESFK